MKIKVLGSGCKNCQVLAERAEEALNELGIEGEIIKVTELDEIIDLGVMMTPGLIVNDNIKSTGKVPKTKEIVKFLQEEK
ncbi:thioredoxin family protein [Proteinivorax hydrogeniformans]|uniref:Thioredoxin family protein n=1 Tax=Proteinivorax hydrogeniformans TaxID=1826727 RepID=A0AAU8HWJ0_9FIRM